MAKVIKKVAFGEHTLILETGEVARQASSVLVTMLKNSDLESGGTMVLATAVCRKEPGNQDFFPLTVNYQERAYAAGKIPGGFKKREGSLSEEEIINARLIDRPIRPLFPEEFRQETQVVATVLSSDQDIAPDIVAMIGASAALTLSDAPFQGPIGAARVGYKDGVYLLNPDRQTLEHSLLNLVVAGTKDAILMVESEAKELSEDIMLGAIMYGHEMMKGVIKAIEELAQEVRGGKGSPWVQPVVANEALIKTRVSEIAQKDIEKAYLVKDKAERYQRLDELRAQTLAALQAENTELDPKQIINAFGQLERTIVRQGILRGEPRIDGRDHRSVRPIWIRPKFLVRTHGSCLFTRGETQAIVVATLGNERDAQMLDGIAGQSKDRFMLHYNFPPYSVGETGMMGSPKRREIGHGRLAKRALIAVLPKASEFPYVLRVVSEITESNGSSSMATVCGTSLALMDAGVPITAPVAGVAMGLIKEGDQFAILTDILGDEDHLGDMDFKVAGTQKGVTALQMDIKITGITANIMEQALEQALEGRKHILGVMNNALSEHRGELSQYAPRIMTMKIAEDKIRTVIGKGGATIKSLTESTGVSIDIDDSGVLQLFSPDLSALEEAEKQIKLLIADLEVGQTYQGKVSKLVEFGAFINLLPGKDGLLHVSQICVDRNQKVESILSEGQEIEVFVAGIDKQGRVKLEWKDKPTSTPTTDEVEPTAEPIQESQSDDNQSS